MESKEAKGKKKKKKSKKKLYEIMDVNLFLPCSITVAFAWNFHEPFYNFTNSIYSTEYDKS